MHSLPCYPKRIGANELNRIVLAFKAFFSLLVFR